MTRLSHSTCLQRRHNLTIGNLWYRRQLQIFNWDWGIQPNYLRNWTCLTFVNRVHAVDESSHLSRVDIISKLFSFAYPGLGEGVSEWSNFRDEIRMRDVERTTRSNFGKLSGVDLVIIVISGTLYDVNFRDQTEKASRMFYLSEILFAIFPIPGVPAKRDPVIESSFATRNPGVIVQARTTAENFTSGVRLFQTSVFRTIYECSLVWPIIWTVTELESTGRSSDFWDFTRIAGKLSECRYPTGFLLGGLPNTSFNDQNRNFWVLSQTSSNDVSCSTTCILLVYVTH